MTPEIYVRNFCFQKKGLKPLFLLYFVTKGFYTKTNLDQIMTSHKAKLGPDNNTTAYIYIYIYIDR